MDVNVRFTWDDAKFDSNQKPPRQCSMRKENESAQLHTATGKKKNTAGKFRGSVE